MVAVIDYGMGNLRSVLNALAAIECPAFIAERPPQLVDAEKVVLPGVGAFGDGMANLRAAGWIETLETEVRRKGKPFLGICLGMQLLATKGLELGEFDGLDWVSGVADRLPAEGPEIRIPHIGWNDVAFVKQNGLYAGLGDTGTFYFVHSYALLPEDRSVVTGTCNYGVDFPASIEFENILATQYHPEKSQRAGLGVLRNFARIAA